MQTRLESWSHRLEHLLHTLLEAADRLCRSRFLLIFFILVLYTKGLYHPYWTGVIALFSIAAFIFSVGFHLLCDVVCVFRLSAACKDTTPPASGLRWRDCMRMLAEVLLHSGVPTLGLVLTLRLGSVPEEVHSWPPSMHAVRESVTGRTWLPACFLLTGLLLWERLQLPRAYVEKQPAGLVEDAEKGAEPERERSDRERLAHEILGSLRFNVGVFKISGFHRF